MHDFVSRRRPPAGLIYMLGALGGVVGIVAAFQQEITHLSALAMLTAGPIEELCKPLVLIVMLDKRPWWIKRRWEVILMAMLAAGLFATLENLLYLKVAIANPSVKLIWFRWTVCTGLHLTCSAIAAAGIAQQWQRMVTGGERFRLGRAFALYYLVAAGIHAGYNGVVWVLESSDTLVW